MRKKPTQARSKFLVNSVIDATAQVIASQGISAVTTLKVADAAGISVGSLYQYFENKEDLYEALLERMTSELMFVVDEATNIQKGVDGQTTIQLKDWIIKLLNLVWQYLDQKNQLYLHVIRYWSDLGFTHGMDMLFQKLQGVLAIQIMQVSNGRVIPNNLNTKLFIIINSTLFTLVRYLSLSKPNIDRHILFAEIAQMIELMLS